MIENDPVFTELYDVRRFRSLIAQRPKPIDERPANSA
jgi:hypothetical protein